MNVSTDRTGALLGAGLAAVVIGGGAWFFGRWIGMDALIIVLVIAAFIFAGTESTRSQQGIAKSKWADRGAIDAANIAQTLPREAQEADAGREGIYLGFYADRMGTKTLRYKGEKHLLTFGAPGANKSTGLVVPNLAHLPRSIIALDPKGQLAAITARKRATMGRVIVLNPFGLFADTLPHLDSAGWNPLLQLDPEGADFEDGARVIADALIEKSGGDGGNAKFFDSSAENLVAALVMWERLTNGNKASLRNLRATLTEPNIFDKRTKEPLSGFLHTLRQMAESDNAAISNAGRRLYSRLTDQSSQATSAQDVIDTVLANTRFLDNPCIGADMAFGGAIDFGALHREVTTIYVILPVDQLENHAKWLRLFVNLALQQLYKNPRPLGGHLPPVLFMLDEFANIGRLREITRALTISRDFGIQLWMFLHYVEQLKTHYSKEWAGFFTGSGAVTTFRTGDAETPELLAKLYGNREEFILTQNPTGGMSATPHAIPLIRPEDIGRLGKGESITLIEPCAMPIKASAPVYPQTAYALGLDPNPYYRA